MTIHTDLGYIEITSDVIADIAGYAASSCFGVKGMTVRSVSDGLAHLLRKENQRRGRTWHQHRFRLPFDHWRSALSRGASDRCGRQKRRCLRGKHQGRLITAVGGTVTDE